MDHQKILLLGPRSNIKNPKLTGGEIILFEQLIKDLKKLDLVVSVIDTNMSNYPNMIMGIIQIYLQILSKIRFVDHISLHGTIKSYLYIAPFVVLVAKIAKKKSSLRKFAGSFHEFYERSGKLKQKLISMVLKYADFTFYETKYLVDYFSKWNERTYWFPNVRERGIIPDVPRSFRRKFVFISHVIKSKGIDIILKASEKFDESYAFDIYGPILNNDYKPEELSRRNVNYKGPLHSDEVLEVLNNYDVLMLPSFKEGYPGIILEAYSLGIPIISTSLASIEEICDSGKEGFLIEPGNIEQFCKAVSSFNSITYGELSINAFNRFEFFDSESFASKFYKIITSSEC
jgi:glycosyltransferase involved in cell wall biosynthesis